MYHWDFLIVRPSWPRPVNVCAGARSWKASTDNTSGNRNIDIWQSVIYSPPMITHLISWSPGPTPDKSPIVFNSFGAFIRRHSAGERHSVAGRRIRRGQRQNLRSRAHPFPGPCHRKFPIYPLKKPLHFAPFAKFPFPSLFRFLDPNPSAFLSEIICNYQIISDRRSPNTLPNLLICRRLRDFPFDAPKIIFRSRLPWLRPRIRGPRPTLNAPVQRNDSLTG